MSRDFTTQVTEDPIDRTVIFSVRVGAEVFKTYHAPRVLEEAMKQLVTAVADAWIAAHLQEVLAQIDVAAVANGTTLGLVNKLAQQFSTLTRPEGTPK